MDARGVDRELRAKIWLTLPDYGFQSRASRVAWRYGEGVDLVEISSVGSSWDAVGCTSFSISARVAAIPVFIKPQRPIPQWDAKPRPHYWHCQLQLGLRKSLSQPWFHPFAEPQRNLPRSFALHREGLNQVLRRDVHDRSDIWFIKDDGSNVDAVMGDLLAAIEGEGLAVLQRFHDPNAVIKMALAGELGASPGSPAAKEVIRAARDFLAANPDRLSR